QMMWLLSTAAFVDAPAALRMGLVTEVVPDERVFDRAREIAAMICENSSTSTLAAKLARLHSRGMAREHSAGTTSRLWTMASARGGAAVRRGATIRSPTGSATTAGS